MNKGTITRMITGLLALVLAVSLPAVMPVQAQEPTYRTLRPGSILTLGTLPDQDQENPLQWIVLDCEDGIATLTTRYALASLPYHGEKEGVSWEDSSIRQWLNGEFYDQTFSREEKDLIQESYLRNWGNPQYPVEGCEPTFDYVFLLSYEEVMDDFSTDRNRRLAPGTPELQKELEMSSKYDTCWWYLRTPGSSDRQVMAVNPDGTVDVKGVAVNAQGGGIRPAIRILVP